jgi:hypothetical protein
MRVESNKYLLFLDDSLVATLTLSAARDEIRLQLFILVVGFFFV